MGVTEGDKADITCATRYRIFEFLVMPFGLTNAPTTFCNLVNDVLFDFLDSFVVVYLDDIVIYSPTLEDHLVPLKNVFDRLRQNQLYVKKEKCKFAQTEIKFMGHLISKSQILMDSAKGGSNLRMVCPYQGDRTSILFLVWQTTIEGSSRVIPR